MPLEVLNEHLVHAVRCRWVAAGVSHRASTAVEILPHYHRNFPQSWIGSRGTGRYHAVVEELIIQRVRPAGRPVLIDRHRGVIREVRVPEHLEHVVAADLRVQNVVCAFPRISTRVIGGIARNLAFIYSFNHLLMAIIHSI